MSQDSTQSPVSWNFFDRMLYSIPFILLFIKNQLCTQEQTFKLMKYVLLKKTDRGGSPRSGHTIIAMSKYVDLIKDVSLRKFKNIRVVIWFHYTQASKMPTKYFSLDKLFWFIRILI